MLIGIDASRAVTARRTGTEAYAWFLIRELIPLAGQRGHTVRLYFNQPPPDDLFPQADHVENVLIPQARLWTHTRLAAELHRRPPDVFFTPAHVIPLSYHGRAVATIHDLGYHHFPESHPRRQRAYLRWSTRHNGRRSWRVIADSQATKEDLIRFDGISPDKIVVIYPGVDPALHPVTDAARMTAVLKKHNITPPYFLFLSTLQPRKNLSRLLDAYVQSGVPHKLVLAGKPGWLSQPILDKITSLPASLSEKIILPGYIPDADKAALLSGATVVLYPSLHEGFGFPVLEAQACGTAVLTATTSSLPEVAGNAALLVDPLDTAALATGIRRLAQDETLRKALEEKGLVNVRRFSWEDTAVQVLNLFENKKDRAV
ncbi:MAG TPA: glycosyltransferase family 1 protein [Anaerolineae bacterium]|nr:glycosyltransferase family 1 protein [Anaerolineae bacterium]HIP72450.1 glycosyltransferase family 1 protein [Anaerolineae bacterium]